MRRTLLFIIAQSMIGAGLWEAWDASDPFAFSYFVLLSAFVSLLTVPAKEQR